MAPCDLCSSSVFAWSAPSQLDAPASAHIGVTPGLLVVGDTQTLTLTVHNDLDRPMTGLSVSAPTGVRVGLGDVRTEWEAIVEDDTATWTGGPLAANTGTTFEVELAVDAATPAGPVQLRAEQLSGRGTLPWPISVTVDSGARRVLAATHLGDRREDWLCSRLSGIALIALRRRARTLQEQ